MTRTTVIGLLGTCLCIAGCGKTTWREFNCRDGRYSIQMPGDPKLMTVRHGDKLLVEHSALLESGKYSVMYADEEGAPTNLSKFGESWASANVTKRQSWTLEGVQGVELELELTGGDGYSSKRLIIIGTRLYLVSVRGQNAKLDNPDVKSFFKSFKSTN